MVREEQEGFPARQQGSRLSGAKVGAAALLVCVGLLFSGLAPSPFSSAAPVDTYHGQSCTTSDCHPARHDQPGLISHPAYLEEWCDRCHTDHSSSEEMLLRATPGELCLQCHTETETHEHTVLHPPEAGSCVDCHDPHQSTIRHMLRSEEVLRQCAECHEEDLQRAARLPYHHRFFDARAECGSCHHAHRPGEDGAYLRAGVGQTCLTCHDMTILSDGRPLENVGLALRRASFVHEPLREKACDACHTPHGSVQPSLLREGYPAGSYEQYDRERYSLCWTCHDSALVETPRSAQATGFRDGTRNLHNLHVLSADRGRACHLCHTAHVSERPFLLRETIQFRQWASDFQFEVLPNGGTCTTACHRTETYSRSTP